MGVEMRKNEMARKDHFRGPCKDVCKQYCACCVSADGRTLYGCVPIAHSRGPYVYTLPLCLHMCLCPQQGGHPCDGLFVFDEGFHAEDLVWWPCCVNLSLCCLQETEKDMASAKL